MFAVEQLAGAGAFSQVEEVAVTGAEQLLVEEEELRDSQGVGFGPADRSADNETRDDAGEGEAWPSSAMIAA